MPAPTDMLSEASLRRSLGDLDPFFSIFVHSSLDSTNSEARRLAATSVPLPAVIAADTQTAGRGRMGRGFFSPAGTGLYFSLLYESSASPADAVTVTGAAAVAVMHAIRSLTGMQVSIKWVNDLYLGGKKICGILAESIFAGNTPPRFILGIGVNLSTEAFPEELSAIAGSLMASGVSRADLLAQILRELNPFLQDPTDRSWLADYRAHSLVIGKRVAWTREGQVEHGIALDIDANGGLSVRSDAGVTQTLRTGEISLRVCNP